MSVENFVASVEKYFDGSTISTICSRKVPMTDSVDQQSRVNQVYK